MKKAPRFALAVALALCCAVSMVPARARQELRALAMRPRMFASTRKHFRSRRLARPFSFMPDCILLMRTRPTIAYGPHNKGLDFTANARRGGKFMSVATGADGTPVIQRSGRFKGFYVSTTSLRNAAGSVSSPGTYVNATKIPYVVLPPEFMAQFGITLGDLALVTNLKNGKSSFAIFADVESPRQNW